MGHEKGRHGRSKVKFTNFLMMGREMVLHCEEWKQLSPRAKILYLYIKAKHNGTNNGLIRLHYSELATVRGFGSPSTVANAFRELVKNGWITKSSKKWVDRTTNLYGLTGRYDTYFTDRSHIVPEKYKDTTPTVVQSVPPVGPYAVGLKISQPVSTASDQVRTTEIVAMTTNKCS
jgi:hypothetical protein